MKPLQELSTKYRKYQEACKRASKTFYDKNKDAKIQDSLNYYYLNREDILRRAKEARAEKKRLRLERNNENVNIST